MMSSSLFRRASLHGFVLVAIVAALIGPLAPAAQATHNLVSLEDVDGANDQPGQKDLTLLEVDDTHGEFTYVNWNWDELTGFSGNNTGDACSLWDTDNDGLVNFAMCVTIQDDANGVPVQTSVRIYSCDESPASVANRRCTSSLLLPGPYDSTSAITSPSATDPFPAGDDFPDDTRAETLFDFDDITGTPTLLNVCSYPSQQPNSDPSDCIVTPGTGFLEIHKDATPNDGTAFVFTASANPLGPAGQNPWTINGSGSVTLIPYSATTTLDLNESIPPLWQLDSATCTLQGGGATGTSTATGVDNFTIQAGRTTACTFTDSLSVTPPVIEVTKTADPTTLPEPGGTSTFTVTVENSSSSAATLTVLDDNVYGDLLDSANPDVSNNTCDDALPINLAASDGTAGSGTDFFSCSFDGAVSGNAGSSHTNIVTATATNDAGESTDTDDATVTIDDVAPAVTVTKTPNPTSLDEPGGTVTFTVTIENDSAEAVDVTVLDDDVYGDLLDPTNGDVSNNTCDDAPISLAASDGTAGSGTDFFTCSFTAQVTGNAGSSHTDTVTGTVTDDDGSTATDTDDATVNILAQTGQIAPTATTCQDFVDGDAGDLTEVFYGVKGNKINNVSPGVLFYYSLVTVSGAGTHEISVTQSTSPGFTLFGIQQNQAVLYNADCVKLANNATGTFAGLTAGTYVVGIKYDPSTVIGQTKPGGNGEVVYTFTTNVDGTPVLSSPDSLTLKPRPKN